VITTIISPVNMRISVALKVILMQLWAVKFWIILCSIFLGRVFCGPENTFAESEAGVYF
jgi:hypothetical protein